LIVAGRGDAEVYAMAEDLRELLVDMRTKVEAKLDQHG
jgi:hypothetical protein